MTDERLWHRISVLSVLSILFLACLVAGCDDPKKAKEEHDAAWGSGRDFADRRTAKSFGKSMNMEIQRGNTKGAAAIGDALSRWRLEAEK